MRQFSFALGALAAFVAATTASSKSDFPELSEFVTTAMGENITVSESNIFNVVDRVMTRFGNDSGFDAEKFDYLIDDAEIKLAEPHRLQARNGGGYYECSVCLCGAEYAASAKRAVEVSAAMEKQEKAEQAKSVMTATGSAAMPVPPVNSSGPPPPATPSPVIPLSSTAPAPMLASPQAPTLASPQAPMLATPQAPTLAAPQTVSPIGFMTVPPPGTPGIATPPPAAPLTGTPGLAPFPPAAPLTGTPGLAPFPPAAPLPGTRGIATLPPAAPLTGTAPYPPPAPLPGTRGIATLPPAAPLTGTPGPALPAATPQPSPAGIPFDTGEEEGQLFYFPKKKANATPPGQTNPAGVPPVHPETAPATVPPSLPATAVDKPAPVAPSSSPTPVVSGYQPATVITPPRPAGLVSPPQPAPVVPPPQPAPVVPPTELAPVVPLTETKGVTPYPQPEVPAKLQKRWITMAIGGILGAIAISQDPTARREQKVLQYKLKCSRRCSWKQARTAAKDMQKYCQSGKPL